MNSKLLSKLIPKFGKNERGKKIFCGFYIAACILIMYFFAAYTISALFDGFHSLLLLAPTAAFLLAFFALVFGNVIPKTLRMIFFCGMYAYLISFAVLVIYIFSFASINEKQALTIYDKEDPVNIMVFGCRTYGYTPGQSLEGRLQSALTLLEHYPNSSCVVSGGQGKNETVSEAESMRAWLVEHGIDEDRIYKEDKSTDTLENIEYSFKVMEVNDLSTDMIIGVSNRYHLARISWIASHDGVSMTLYPSDTDNIFWLSIYLTREDMSYAKVAVFSLLGL